MTARERLDAGLLKLAERGETTPCQCRRRDRWTSDDHDERAWAASVCTSLGCPLLAQCGAAADETGEKHGVWAGVDRTPTTRKRGTPGGHLLCGAPPAVAPPLPPARPPARTRFWTADATDHPGVGPLLTHHLWL